jgi:hypothetical protein
MEDLTQAVTARVPTCIRQRLRRCLTQKLAIAHQTQSLIARLNGPGVSFGSAPLDRRHELGVEKKRIQPLGLINQIGSFHTAPSRRQSMHERAALSLRCKEAL